MSAAERLATVDDLPAAELCRRTSEALDELVRAMNEETTLLRAGHYKQAGPVTSEKIRLAQEYVGMVRAVQRQSTRLRREAPEEALRLKEGHEKLATQMADNLRVIATARTIAASILTDVAVSIGAGQSTKTYGAGGELVKAPGPAVPSIAVNRAL